MQAFFQPSGVEIDAMRDGPNMCSLTGWDSPDSDPLGLLATRNKASTKPKQAATSPIAPSAYEPLGVQATRNKASATPNLATRKPLYNAQPSLYGAHAVKGRIRARNLVGAVARIISTYKLSLTNESEWLNPKEYISSFVRESK
jgi:hypothetical protein